MATSATLHLPMYKANTRKGIGQDIVECAEKDYLYVLRTIPVQEIDGQKAIGNKPTNIIVDGRGGKPIDQATKSVYVYFSDAAVLIRAIYEAYAQLQTLGRRVTGDTLGQARYYQSVGKNGAVTQIGTPTEVSIPKADVFKTDLYVALPVAHIRKWQYLNRAGGLLKRKSKDRRILRGVASGGYSAAVSRVQQSVFDRVAQVVRRKFKLVEASFMFIKHANVNAKGKTSITEIPAVKVFLKRRGRLYG